MKLSAKSGATLAAAAAALVMSNTFIAAPVAFADDAKVKCFGVNECKGKSDCKTASSECKGKNSCSGKGFMSLTAAECTTKGGTTTEG